MRRVLIVVAGLALLLVIVLQVLVYFSQPTSTEELETRVGTLPELVLVGMDGVAFDLPTGKPVVLIYFNSTCDHCQREITALRAKKGLFEDAALVMMSAEQIETVRSFASRMDFGESDAQFVHVTHEEISKVFGTLSLPHIFVYSTQGKLLGIFEGETTPEAIAAVLP